MRIRVYGCKWNNLGWILCCLLCHRHKCKLIYFYYKTQRIKRLQYIQDLNAESLKQSEEETRSDMTGADMTGADMMLLGRMPRHPPNIHSPKAEREWIISIMNNPGGKILFNKKTKNSSSFDCFPTLQVYQKFHLRRILYDSILAFNQTCRCQIPKSLFF